MRKASLLSAVLLLPLLLAAKTTTLYHTSDTHGFFFPRNGQGGFAALEAVLKSGPKHYLLLDSGDFANGTIETNTSKGLKAVEVFNKMGYDASTIGNHEFDFKNAGFAPLAAHAQFALLAANFFEKGTQKYPPHVAPYKIFETDGVKVAVIGLANRTPTNPATDYTFSKPLEAVEHALAQAEKDHPQLVVVLVHDSLQDDKHGTQSYTAEIGEKFGGRIHVVLGGHAHKIVQNKFINGTLYVESGCYTQNVSKISVETDDQTGKVVSAKSELIPLIVDKVGEDAAMKDFLETVREPNVDTPVGTAAKTLAKKPTAADRMDSPLDDWIADLIKAYTGTEIAFTNNGGTRVDMRQGPITRRDLIEIHPFSNKISVVKVKGKFLKKFIKAGFAPRSLFTYSGLDISYKQNKKGEAKNIKVLFKGKPLENNKVYAVATNSYIAGGGSEGYLFKQIPDADKRQIGDKSIRDLMEDGLQRGDVLPPETGRMHKR